MNINLYIKLKKYKLDKKLLLKNIKKILSKLKLNHHELTLVLVNNNAIRKLNKKYFNKNSYTDVISFPINEKYPKQNKIFLGDIFISLDEIYKNAKKYNVNFENELHRIIIHGILHLIGYEDNTRINRKKMGALTELILLALL
jgi:rRNA maturation RNase YbeY